MAVEAQTPRELELERKQKEADALNATRTGVGTRLRVGQTRGKNPLVIQWEAFDDSKPDSLPKNPQEFVSVTKVTEAIYLQCLIEGYNQIQYTAASDPLAEYVESYWPDDAQAQFRIIVRNYSKLPGETIESAVNLIKPGFEKQYKQS